MKIKISSPLFRYFVIVAYMFITGCATGTFNQRPLDLYATQVDEAEVRNSPLIITRISTAPPNSANGVDVEIDFLAVSASPIKYATFTTIPYNAVQDSVASEIGGKIKAKLKVTGPYHKGTTNSGNFWEAVWYNPSITCAAIEKVEVILMDGEQRIYSGSNLGDVFSSGYVNQCGNNVVKNALSITTNNSAHMSKAAPSADYKDMPTDIHSLPENTGGVSIDIPSVVENGNVVPVSINVDNPILPGDKLIIAGDAEQALELVTDIHPISMVSTRLRLSSGHVAAFVIRGSGQIDSITKNIRISIPAHTPPSTGNGKVSNNFRSKGNEVKILFTNDMALSGFIRVVNISTSNGVIRAYLTPKISKNPYLAIRSPDKLFSVSVDAGL